jgi:hypothetical protein
VFETKRQRGLLLLIIIVGFIIASIVVDSVTSSHAGDRALRVEERVRAILVDPPSPGPDASLNFLRENDLKSFFRENGAVLVSADGGSVWSPRCVVARRNESGEIETRIVKRPCHDITVTTDLFEEFEA